MAKLYLNIEADTVEEYFDILIKLGAKPITVTVPDREAAKPTPASVEVAEEAPTVEQRIEEVQEIPGDVDLDANGYPWSDIYASSKLKTQDGLWRMRKGCVRPPAMEGYPKTDVVQNVEAVTEPMAEPEPEQPDEGKKSDGATEDDEFAQFRTPAEPEVVAEPASTIREWSDADVSNAANWAVNQLGGTSEMATKVGAARNAYIPAGMVPKTMNIPVEDREKFVIDLEELVGSKYPG